MTNITFNKHSYDDRTLLNLDSMVSSMQAFDTMDKRDSSPDKEVDVDDLSVNILEKPSSALKAGTINKYIKRVVTAVKHLNNHLYQLTSPLVQKQALFGTLVDKVYDYFMDRIVGDGTSKRLIGMVNSPIHRYEVEFYLHMEKLLSRLMAFKCINKTDFKYQIA